MKKLFLILTAFSINVAAQTGEALYTRTISFGDIKMDGVPAELAAMMPKEAKSNHVLYFSPQATMYENAPQEKKETKEMSGEGFHIRIDTDDEEEKYYTDLLNKKVVQQRELAGRTFLINGDQKQHKWKMTGNQKKILDHVVMEATCITGKDTIEAWYAPDITVPSGPESLGGLPGLILEATINKNMTFAASAIHPDKNVSDKIKEPKKGKKATYEEFSKLEEERHQEQLKEASERGGTGKKIMIMR